MLKEKRAHDQATGKFNFKSKLRKLVVKILNIHHAVQTAAIAINHCLI